MTEPPRSPRAERRAATERRILAAARRVFAERGFERATIRSVASLAGVDPALVMHYFGSKQELFLAAIRPEPAEMARAGSSGLTELLLTSLGMKIGDLPESALAMMRSMLSHPEAASAARGRVNEQVDQLSAAIRADDARLRAVLAITTMLGVTIGRHLLDLDELRAASPDRVADLLRPCLRELLTGTPER